MNTRLQENNINDKKTVHGIIYKIENKINNKVYIGQTIGKFNTRYKLKGEGIERVFNSIEGYKRYGEPYNIHLYKSINKYGFDAFEVAEEFDIAYSKDELDKKEKYWIKHYNSTDERYGYNNTVGGDGFVIGKSSYLSKLGASKKPIYCLNINKAFLTISEASRNTGIGTNTIRNICVGGSIYYSYSKIYCKNLEFEYIDLENKSKQPVICVTTGETFRNYKEASKHYKISGGQILKNCNGIGKSAGKQPETKEKLLWMFALDYLIETEF